ncbi:MAG: hypothetical protein WCA44_02170 [Acidobacteriaceae bacterium]|jgi:uncharacterized membrane protein YidH (DUF202 family)
MAKFSGAVMEAKPQTGDDGTRALLRAGIGILAAGLIAAVLAATVFGPIGIHGPHNNGGWLSLMAAMMCLPFGLMLFALGFAKWLRNRRMRRQPPNS